MNITAGAGAQPYAVQGKAYLAGPYKNAPLSLAVITPAIAGPFDLGTVVVRVALYIDQNTSQIHAVSDPLPTILDGIPLDLRSVSLSMDRSGFTFNPTSCEADEREWGSDLHPRPDRWDCPTVSRSVAVRACRSNPR